MNTPFGPAINLGTLDNPNYAGAAGGVAYLRGIHTAFQVLQDLEHDVGNETAAYDTWRQCIEAVEGLLKGSPPPDSASGRDPNPPTAVTTFHVAAGNNPEKADRT